MMDGKNRLKHVERLTEIKKLIKVASCSLYSENIFAMHGPINVKSYNYIWFKTLIDGAEFHNCDF